MPEAPALDTALTTTDILKVDRQVSGVEIDAQPNQSGVASSGSGSI